MVYGGSINSHSYWETADGSFGIWNDGGSGTSEDWVFGPLQSCKIAYPNKSLKIEKNKIKCLANLKIEKKIET